MSFTNSITMVTKMIMTMMMSYVRVKRKNLTTDSLNCLLKQIKGQNQMKKQKDFLRRFKIEKRELIKRDL